MPTRTDEWSPEGLGALSMTEIVRLQDLLSRELKRRFEKELALVFSDVVGSTDYFARFGDEVGRRMQQRHFDLLGQVVVRAGARVVDTAGDGAFIVCPTVEVAARCFIELQRTIARENLMHTREQQLSVRIGIHWGRVLTDGRDVTGESVNLAARVRTSAAPDEIRITKEAFEQLGEAGHALSAHSLGVIELKGLASGVALLALDWREREAFPDAVWIVETGQEIPLPDQDTIRFGRLRASDGLPANDIVLSLPDETDTRKISRRHFELRRQPGAFLLRSVSERSTEIDGAVIARGVEAPVKPGSLVRVGRVLTLKFVRSPETTPSLGDATIDQQ